MTGTLAISSSADRDDLAGLRRDSSRRADAKAQNFPSGTIRIVVPNSAATPPDILARIVANALSRIRRLAVVVENKPGGAMTIGAAEVLKQPADGHTISRSPRRCRPRRP